MRIDYDFADLEAFIAVLETGSFHLAAERLALSQSAVTRRVQKLENALGSVLFERTTRKVRPTLAAKRLQARAEAILEDARETTRAMRDESMAFAHQRGLVISVALIPTVVGGLLPPALAAFRELGHRARIRLLEAAANEVAETVAEGEADFGICAIPALEPATTFEPLFDDQIVLVLTTDHPLAAQDTVSTDDLRNWPVILPARGTGNRVLIDEALAKLRASLVWTYETERATTALSLAAGGVGLALLPRMMMHSPGDPRLCWRPLSDLHIARPVGLLTRIGQTDSASLSAFKDAIRGAAIALA